LNDFPYIGNFIIPTDELIFFRGVAQPPTGIYFILVNTVAPEEPREMGKIQCSELSQ
jgi:hypothetical protein